MKKKIFKYLIFFLLLCASHMIFFITVDSNRSVIKNKLVNAKIWNGKIHYLVKNTFTLQKEKKKNLDLKSALNTPDNFNLTFYKSEHEIYDLNSIAKNLKNVPYGYFTSIKKINNQLHLVTSNGYIFVLDEKYLLKKKLFIKDIYKKFHTDYGLGGARGAVWPDSENVIIYTTTKNKDKYQVSLVSINIKQEKAIDELFIQNLPNNNGFAVNLGGGIEMRNMQIYLALGDGAEMDDHIKSKISQDDQSNFGKIIKINIKIENNFYFFKGLEKLSKGLRNPQGLKLIDNYFLFVEHGPKGGDELNIFNPEIKKKENYGWPIHSYGLPYVQAKNLTDAIYKNTYNNFNKNFSDPIFYFTPSIATSDISECPFKKSEYEQYRRCILISSLKDQSFYLLKYKNDKKKITIKSYERVFVR